MCPRPEDLSDCSLLLQVLSVAATVPLTHTPEGHTTSRHRADTGRAASSPRSSRASPQACFLSSPSPQGLNTRIGDCPQRTHLLPANQSLSSPHHATRSFQNRPEPDSHSLAPIFPTPSLLGQNAGVHLSLSIHLLP